MLVPRHTSLLSGGAAELGRAGDVVGAGEVGGHYGEGGAGRGATAARAVGARQAAGQALSWAAARPPGCTGTATALTACCPPSAVAAAAAATRPAWRPWPPSGCRWHGKSTGCRPWRRRQAAADGNVAAWRAAVPGARNTLVVFLRFFHFSAPVLEPDLEWGRGWGRHTGRC